jgi:Xaa-Pro aminopeptidase
MKAEEYAERRRHLLAGMGEGSVAVVPAARELVRNRDVHYPFRQDSDFHYLTGFPEPDAVAVLAPGRPEGEFILFCRERDPLMETWNGRRAGPEGARERFAADDAHVLAEIDELLPEFLENRDRLYYAVGADADFDTQMMAWLNAVRARGRAGITAPREIIGVDYLLHEMRLVKSPAELDIMHRAGQISAQAHRQAMATTRPGMREYQIEAELLAEFRRHGCDTAYSSIVGGGANACILHYTENDAVLNDGELLLIDAGAELECYASDITRTFPINGRFSGEQRAIYELVLEAQRVSIEAVQPGASWQAPHEASVRVLTQGLVDLGLLQGEVDGLIEAEGYRRFYMHRTGHWLGLDVHDVGDYRVQGEWRRFQPGMVCTVEPGLYIAAGSEGAEKRWWNIGVRIEDDVAVTQDGHWVLTEAAPKLVAEVEALMADSRQAA